MDLSLFLMLLVPVTLMIAQWKIFRKAGKSGFLSLIPVVNIYYMGKIIGASKLYLAFFLLCIAKIIIGSGTGFVSGFIGILISGLLFGIHIASVVCACFSFSVPLQLIAICIFIPILLPYIIGFKECVYHGPTDLKSLISGMIKEDASDSASDSQEQD